MRISESPTLKITDPRTRFWTITRNKSKLEFGLSRCQALRTISNITPSSNKITSAWLFRNHKKLNLNTSQNMKVLYCIWYGKVSHGIRTRRTVAEDSKNSIFVLPDGETQSSRECFAMFTKETLFDLADHVWSTRYRISLWFL